MGSRKMRAWYVHGPSDLRLEEVERPEPRQSEVLVRIEANGICGSDIHFYAEGRLGPRRVERPYVPGHESSGVVAELGPQADRHSVGAHVVIEPGVACGVCDVCKSGRYNLCPRVVFLSAPPTNGTFAEYVAVRQDFVHRVDERVPFAEAALAEPLAVGMYGCKRADVRPGALVLVLGAGPIGLTVLLAARKFGASKVLVADFVPGRLSVAMKLGATGVVDLSKCALEAGLSGVFGSGGADVAFEAAGAMKASVAAVRAVKAGGVVALIGWPEQPEFTYPLQLLIEKELDVRGVYHYANSFAPAIQLIESGEVNLSPLVTHRFPFSRADEAFRFASRNRQEVVKAVVLSEEG